MAQKKQQPKTGCDCIDKLEKKFGDHITNELNNRFKAVQIIEYGFVNKSLIPAGQIYVEMEAKYSFIKKDGNLSNPKKKTVNVFFTFCPFCGQKLNISE
jgi:hypothetical protein